MTFAPSMRRFKSRTVNNRPRTLQKPTLTDGYEAKSRLSTVQQMYDRYVALGRDALTAGDRVVAEGYYQHADHYLRCLNDIKSTVEPPIDMPDTNAEEASEEPSEDARDAEKARKTKKSSAVSGVAVA